MPRSTRPPRQARPLLFLPFQVPGSRSGHGAQAALEALVRDRCGKVDDDQRDGAAAPLVKRSTR